MLGKKIKELRKSKNISAEDLAAKIGVSPSTIYRYENGDISKVNIDNLKQLAYALDTTASFLMGWTDNSVASSDKSKPLKSISIPVLGRVIAGVPVEAMEEIIGYEDISIEESKGGNFFALQIKGESMEPKFSSGDVVIVRQQPTVESGDIAVVMVNGSDATVKRVILHEEGGLSLIALNPAYPPKYFTDHEIQSLPISIAGKVVELRAKF
ncbi:MAG: XRE family transcriptional regulator [Anaerovoracaceae bacterium]